MGKVAEYRTRLKSLENWQSFLLEESGLPGVRANLELAEAVAEEGNTKLFLDLLSFSPDRAPTGSRCAVLRASWPSAHPPPLGCCELRLAS